MQTKLQTGPFIVDSCPLMTPDHSRHLNSLSDHQSTPEGEKRKHLAKVIVLLYPFRGRILLKCHDPFTNDTLHAAVQPSAPYGLVTSTASHTGTRNKRSHLIDKRDNTSHQNNKNGFVFDNTQLIICKTVTDTKTVRCSVNRFQMIVEVTA